MTSSQRIQFTAWGPNDHTLKLPAYAVRTDDSHGDDGDVAAAAIARKNRLQVLTCRPDVSEFRNGVVVSRHYQATLGRGRVPLREIWIAVRV